MYISLPSSFWVKDVHDFSLCRQHAKYDVDALNTVLTWDGIIWKSLGFISLHVLILRIMYYDLITWTEYKGIKPNHEMIMMGIRQCEYISFQTINACLFQWQCESDLWQFLSDTSYHYSVHNLLMW